MKILLSIHPEHVEELFAGRKLFEYRRKVPRRWEEIRTIVVYATAPVSAIVGELRVELFHSLGPEYLPYSPTELWSRTRHAAGISEEEFHKYFTGVSSAYAWDVKSVHPYDTPRTLEEVTGRVRPPQGFWYLDVKTAPMQFRDLEARPQSTGLSRSESGSRKGCLPHHDPKAVSG